jgi:hypothetical protein
MNRYRLWVRLAGYSTANTYIYAENDYQARMLGEAQYGVGNVLGCWRED